MSEAPNRRLLLPGNPLFDTGAPGFNLAINPRAIVVVISQRGVCLAPA